MPRPMYLLKDAQLKSLSSKNGRHSDGGNLSLVVKDDGARCSWIFRYYDHRTDKEREKGLGAYPAISLKDAREAAGVLRGQMQAAKNLGAFYDPIAAAEQRREAEKAERAKLKTFGYCADTWLNDIYAREVEERQRMRAENMLKLYTQPIWDKPAEDVSDDDIIGLLKPIWLKKEETARRTQRHIRAILKWAKLSGFRRSDLPADIDHVNARLGKQKKKHQNFASLPHVKVAEFMEKLRAKENSIAAKALEFTVLHGSRISEAAGARWDEIDWDNKVWNIPAGRMKKRKPHRVPLTGDALQVLREMEKQRVNDDPFVFPGTGKRGHINDASTRKVLHELLPDPAPGHGKRRFAQHGFRASLETWMLELGYSDDLRRWTLAQKQPNAVAAAYQRTDLLEQRRPIMERWSKYCRTKPVSGGSKVVQMRRKRA